MDLLPRRLIFLGHLLLTLAFIYTHQLHLELLLALLLHILILATDSTCYPSHCQTPPHYPQQNRCMQQYCQVLKWCRMKHCYKCRRCVHRFDHHCVLLDICIGQFNYKYYFVFLLALLYNTILLLVVFTQEMKDEVSMDQFGAQTFTVKYYLYGFALMGVYFNLIMSSYLVANHTYFLMMNVTTWEYHKRDSIPYLRGYDLYPFDNGVLANIIQIFSTKADRPIDWALQLQQK